MEAVPEPARAEHGERDDHDRHDPGENKDGLDRAPAAGKGPDVQDRGRREHERIDLRGHRQPEQAERESVAPANESRKRADGQRRGKEVVGVQRDRPDRERREREEPGRGVEPAPPRAERHQHEHDSEERGEPTQRHQALEGEVVRAGGQNRGRKKDREGAGRILDEDVAVRKVPAQEAVGVEAVQVDVPIPLGPKEAPVGNRAGREEDRRRQAGDPRCQTQLDRAFWPPTSQAERAAGVVAGGPEAAARAAEEAEGGPGAAGAARPAGAAASASDSSASSSPWSWP